MVCNYIFLRFSINVIPVKTGIHRSIEEIRIPAGACPRAGGGGDDVEEIIFT